METDHKKEIAEKLKISRKEKGLTQAALSEKTGLSLRSIQRIEKAEVSPRAYSLNKLAEALDTSFKIKNKEPEQRGSSNLALKLIVSIGSFLLILIAAQAFLSQATSFPETDFELQLFWFFVVLIIMILQLVIWKNPVKKI